MDAKITKLRLSRMLSYDWLKIVGTAVALILFWILILTMTATRITVAQQFHVHNYLYNYNLTDDFGTLYQNAYKNGVFSYEVIETGAENLSAAGDQLYSILDARLSVGEGDVVFAAHTENEGSKYQGEDGKEYTRTYLESMILRNRYYFYDVEEYFVGMENYLNTYYKGDWKNADNFDKDKVEADFRARIKKNKDKRYKKEKQIQAVLPDECARIQKYRDGLAQFYAYKEAGIVQYTNLSISYEVSNKKWDKFEGAFAINICPDESKLPDLRKYVGYHKEVKGTNEQGEEIVSKQKTAQDMHVAFYKVKEMEEGFQYENVLFLNYLIENSFEKEATQE